jgi:hypothetical protein
MKDDKITKDILDALEIGINAGKICKPEPMIVRDMGSNQTWNVPDGPCGFAWVEFKGNSKIGRRIKEMFGEDSPRNLLVSAYKGYPTGIHLWVSAFGQSYDRKNAMANAVAAHLRACGYESVYGNGRLD